MTNTKIEILWKEHIKPSSPTPPKLRDFKLSFIDERIPPYYMPLIIYYSFNEDSSINQSQMFHQLKTSLADALTLFYPLAGRMKGQISVDCNDQGILYLEAHADARISSVIESPESEVLDKLIPFATSGNVSSAEEQLAVQITSFTCGGIAIGMCISHRIGDGGTLSSFIKSWAAIASRNPTNSASPVFNSATLFPAQNTPDFRPNSTSLSVQPLAVNLVMKRFVFTSSAIDAMKLQVTENTSTVKPSRVEVVTAFLWNRCVAAKGLANLSKTVAYHPVNLRGRIPLLTEDSFGNNFQMTGAESDGETHWIHLVAELRAAFGKVDGEYIRKLLGEKGHELAKDNFMEISRYLGLGNVAVFRFTSFRRSPIYEADLGWGKPVWVSSACIRNRDSILMFDSVEKAGGMEAWIVMADQEMERLLQDMEMERLLQVSVSFKVIKNDKIYDKSGHRRQVDRELIRRISKRQWKQRRPRSRPHKTAASDTKKTAVRASEDGDRASQEDRGPFKVGRRSILSAIGDRGLQLIRPQSSWLVQQEFAFQMRISPQFSPHLYIGLILDC